MANVGYPRIERNINGKPIIDIGPYGGYAVVAAMMYAWLPKQWPPDWVIGINDPRVQRYTSWT